MLVRQSRWFRFLGMQRPNLAHPSNVLEFRELIACKPRTMVLKRGCDLRVCIGSPSHSEMATLACACFFSIPNCSSNLHEFHILPCLPFGDGWMRMHASNEVCRNRTPLFFNATSLMLSLPCCQTHVVRSSETDTCMSSLLFENPSLLQTPANVSRMSILPFATIFRSFTKPHPHARPSILSIRHYKHPCHVSFGGPSFSSFPRQPCHHVHLSCKHRKRPWKKGDGAVAICVW